MSFYASISKQIVNEACTASQYIYKGKKIIHGNIFVKNLGGVILEQFEGIRLIGEIELSEGQQTYHVLRNALRQALALTSLEEICNNSTIYWRAVLSLYFVWTGTFHYGEEVGHELWPSVMNGLGFESDSNLSTSCGRLFIRCLKENSLEEFKNIGGRKYITRILLHGLIPQIHINRFLEELIEPEFQSHVGIYITGEHLIHKWKRSKIINYLPKPIECFIKHGEPINIHTTERFLEMAKRWDEEASSIWRQWGLPKYMVDAFRNFIKSRHIVNIKKSWEFNKERPYLIFDIGQSEVPFLCIPAQKTSPGITFQLKWMDAQDNKHDHDLHFNTMLVDGIHYTDPQEYEVGPSIDGWRLETINKANVSDIRYSVKVPWIQNDEGDNVPLLIFNRSTGKLNLNLSKPVPEIMILVYPQEATLEISGVSFKVGPERISGLWRDWQYALIEIDEGGSLQYSGPNHSFRKDISANIRFSYVSPEYRPQLVRSGQAPIWMQCLEDWPIYIDSGNIAIICPESSYRSWRRSFVKLSRLDKESVTKQLELDFKKKGQQYIASIGFSPHWEPGVYEVALQGPLGLDDVILPFIYLPLNEFERVPIPGTDIAFEFHFRNLRDIPIEPCYPAGIRKVGETSVLSLQKDGGEAFLGAYIFTNSDRPVTLLFARRDIRWSRRIERGFFHWGQFRCKAEEIPVQRVDELVDAKVAVQMDSVGNYFKPGNKLRLLLKTLAGNSDEVRTLDAFDAPTIRRYINDTWIFDLKRFSDLLKSLSDIDAAVVTVESIEDKKELLLFTVRKKLIFKDFQAKTVVGNGGTEKLRISWTPQENDPQTHRVIRIFPAGESINYQNIEIDDGTLPPFEISLEPVKKPALWCLKIEAHQSRFGAFSALSELSPSFNWFRAPKDWADWLEWPELQPEDIYRKIGDINAVKKIINERSLIWTDFLRSFHTEGGEVSFELIRRTLGEDVLIRLLPYTQGNIWEVEAVSQNSFTLKIIKSSVDCTNVKTLLASRKPCEWYRLPDNIEIEFALQNDSHFMGEVNTRWYLVKEDKDISLTSKDYKYGSLDFDYWLSDALHPDETGCIKPLFPSVPTWDKPPELPILKKVEHIDQIILEKWLDRKQEYSVRRSFGNLATLGDLLSSRAREELAPSLLGDREKKAEADSLIKRWRKWERQSNEDSLFVRIIKGYLDKEGPNGLSGAVAFIARMRARSDLWNPRELGVDRDSGLDNLYHSTLPLICQLKPRALLRDLIVSEIVITWYWDKHYAELRKSKFRADYL